MRQTTTLKKRQQSDWANFLCKMPLAFTDSVTTISPTPETGSNSSNSSDDNNPPIASQQKYFPDDASPISVTIPNGDGSNNIGNTKSALKSGMKPSSLKKRAQASPGGSASPASASASFAASSPTRGGPGSPASRGIKFVAEHEENTFQNGKSPEESVQQGGRAKRNAAAKEGAAKASHFASDLPEGSHKEFRATGMGEGSFKPNNLADMREKANKSYSNKGIQS